MAHPCRAASNRARQDVVRPDSDGFPKPCGHHQPKRRHPLLVAGFSPSGDWRRHHRLPRGSSLDGLLAECVEGFDGPGYFSLQISENDCRWRQVARGSKALQLSRNLPGLGGGEIGERPFESMASLLDSKCIVLLDTFTD